MLKKCFIIGLILILAGIAVYGWVLATETKQQQQTAYYKSKYPAGPDENIKQYNEWLKTPPEQRTQLPWGLDKDGKAKTIAQLRQEQKERLKADLDKLAAGEMDVSPFARILYGENWQEQLHTYKTRKELAELAFTASVLCMSVGGTFVTWCLLLWLARLIIKISSYLKNFFPDFFRNQESSSCQQLPETSAEEHEENSDQLSASQQVQSNRLSDLLTNSGWQNFAMTPTRKMRPLVKTEANVADRPHPTGSQMKLAAADKTHPDSSAKSDKKVAVLLCDEKPVESEKSLKTPQTAVGHPMPLENSLKELTQEVSAIRQYAAHQQERVKRLQDGYDWNIIKNFCLRVIRCIDNLENRIRRLSKKGVKTAQLEEIRDELVFALESSGLERFKPEINTDYHGQEKIAEAVKARQRCNDPNQTGKIAKVLRQGYRYVIDEKNIKIVRAAQVKLFG